MGRGERREGERGRGVGERGGGGGEEWERRHRRGREGGGHMSVRC